MIPFRWFRLSAWGVGITLFLFLACPAPLIAQSLVKEVGEASWYGPEFHGKETTSGEIFNQNKLTAAHPTLPLGTKAEVTNLENGKSVEVKINDRGPFVEDRIIDLSKAAAKKLDMKEEGTTTVKIEASPPRDSSEKPSARPAKADERNEKETSKKD